MNDNIINKKNNISNMIWIGNYFYYFGIAFTLYLCAVNNNSLLWLIANSLVLAGILVSLIPDLIINVGYKHISKKIFLISLLLKIAILILVYGYITYQNIKYIVYFSILLFLLNIPFSIILWIQIKKQNISNKEFIERLLAINTEKTEKVLKSLIWNIMLLAVCISFSEEIFILKIIALGICSIIHYFLLERILNDLKKCRVIMNTRLRIFLWAIFILICFISFFKLPQIIGYILIGVYSMVVSDCTMEKETSFKFMKFFK